jgi:hypothetical protein
VPIEEEEDVLALGSLGDWNLKWTATLSFSVPTNS